MKRIALLVAVASFALSNLLLANTALEAVRKEGVGWDRLYQRNMERAKTGGINLLFLGDSITQYWSDPPLRAEGLGAGTASPQSRELRHQRRPHPESPLAYPQRRG